MVAEGAAGTVHLCPSVVLVVLGDQNFDLVHHVASWHCAADCADVGIECAVLAADADGFDDIVPANVPIDSGPIAVHASPSHKSEELLGEQSWACAHRNGLCRSAKVIGKQGTTGQSSCASAYSGGSAEGYSLLPSWRIVALVRNEDRANGALEGDVQSEEVEHAKAVGVHDDVGATDGVPQRVLGVELVDVY